VNSAVGLLAAGLVLAGCSHDPTTQALLDPPLAQPGTASTASPLVIDDSARRYDRDEWGDWRTEQCRDTRARVLIAESTEPVMFTADGCRVLTGRWVSPYTGTVVTDARQVDVDHLVSLSDAHVSGGSAWSEQRRRDYTNDLSDPRTLVAVPASENRSKGDQAPDTWLPPTLPAACEYLLSYVAVKERWGLTVTSAQAASIRNTLERC
jgi:hypothetical protein